MILKQLTRYTNADALEATWVDENDVVIKRHAYSNGQMDMLRADLGADAAQYEDMIAEVAATYVPPAPPSIEEQIAVFDAALVAHLDATARERRYDNRVTCALRAGYPGPFQAEGIAFAAWMDQCNALAYTLLAEVVAGTRPMPESPQALIDLMPAMEWPIWGGNGNFTAAGNVTALLDSADPRLSLPLKGQHSYHTYLTKRNSAQLPEE